MRSPTLLLLQDQDSIATRVNAHSYPQPPQNFFPGSLEDPQEQTNTKESGDLHGSRPDTEGISSKKLDSLELSP